MKGLNYRKYKSFFPINDRKPSVLRYTLFFTSNSIFNSVLHNSLMNWLQMLITQPAFTYSKLTIETLEQGVKYVQS